MLRNMKVIIIGSGHNGLIAAILLARQGFEVVVLEEQEIIGGATRTECPFLKVPNLHHSTASYVLGLMPPELINLLGAKFELIKRDPHYFLPTLEDKYLLFGTDKVAMKENFLKFFSKADWEANEALRLEIAAIRDDLAPSWLEEPLSLEETAEKYIRTKLQKTFINLVTKPVEHYLDRFGFQSELIMAMYAVTDGFSGLTGSFNTPGTGMNFLVHNMCRLPGSDGTFMMVQGGMGAIAMELARLAKEAGAKIVTGSRVEKILITNNEAKGVVLSDGKELRSPIVVCNADPFRMRNMIGKENLPSEFNSKLDGLQRNGTTLKVNMALDRLPTFKCLPENKDQHNATIHLLPQGKDNGKNGNRINRNRINSTKEIKGIQGVNTKTGIFDTIQQSFETVQQGQLSEFPTIEWYCQTQLDHSLQDAGKHHSSAFFVQWVPYELSSSSWEKEEDRYVKHLFSIAEQFAPGFTDSVVEYSAMTPKKIEEKWGMSYGHIHHIDNTFGFLQRMPYVTPIAGLYSCSAGCHPAGSVIGAAGHNAAKRIIKDLQANY